MNKLLIGGAVAALAFATAAATAQPAPPPPPGVASGTAPVPLPAPPGGPHVRMIMNTDHVMTRAEVAGHVREMFARLDTNHDGFITKDEMNAIHERMMGAMHMGEAMNTRSEEHRMPMPDRTAMFDRLDANHDGMISRQEFMAAKPELREQRVMIMRSDADAGPGHMPMPPMDGNKMEFHFERHGPMNGPMGMHGSMGMHGMGMAMGEHLFEMADANHDGRVSLQEAEAAALAHFDRADLNHDGRITPDERERMHQSMGMEHRPS